MAIIQKRADEIKPGDVLPIKDGRVVVLSARGVAGGYVEIVAAAAGESYSELMPRIEREPANVRIAVESPDLTLAQQHAGELVELLNKCVEELPFGSDSAIQVISMLEKIMPPARNKKNIVARRADKLELGDVVVGFGGCKKAVFAGYHDNDGSKVCARFVIEGDNYIRREWIPHARIVDVEKKE